MAAEDPERLQSGEREEYQGKTNNNPDVTHIGSFERFTGLRLSVEFYRAKKRISRAET